MTLECKPRAPRACCHFAKFDVQDLEDEEVEAEDAADASAPRRPGADKRKLADAFERERNKQQKAKEAATVRLAEHCGASKTCCTWSLQEHRETSQACCTACSVCWPTRVAIHCAA